MHPPSAAHPRFAASATPPPVAHSASPGGAHNSERAHFLEYVFAPSTGELWRGGGETERLRPQLASLLELLVRRPKDLVKRAEIQEHLWADRVLDVDRGINFCIRQLRAVLDDDAKQPRFIETLPRQGYRFIAPVRWTPQASERADTADTADTADAIAISLQPPVSTGQAEAFNGHIARGSPATARLGSL